MVADNKHDMLKKFSRACYLLQNAVPVSVVT